MTKQTPLNTEQEFFDWIQVQMENEYRAKQRWGLKEPNRGWYQDNNWKLEYNDGERWSRIIDISIPESIATQLATTWSKSQWSGFKSNMTPKGILNLLVKVNPEYKSIQKQLIQNAANSIEIQKQKDNERILASGRSQLEKAMKEVNSILKRPEYQLKWQDAIDLLEDGTE